MPPSFGTRPEPAGRAPTSAPTSATPAPSGHAEASADAALARWADALRAAALLAVDPWGLGGVALHARHGPVRERWLASLKELLPGGSPWRRVPIHAGDDRLLGGLDLGATLAAGRPIAQAGLLAEADGGVLVLAMAERVAATTAARLCAALDTGECVLARDGLSSTRPARFGVVALDEGADDDGGPPGALLERLAFRLELDEIGVAAMAALGVSAEAAEPADDHPDGDAIAAARERLPEVTAGDDVLQALAATALALGVASMRATVLAVRAARVAAALEGRDRTSSEDASLAARLVLAPRATRWPQPSAEEPPPDAQPPEPPAEAPDEDPPPPEPPRPESEPETAPPESTPDDPATESAIDDLVLEAARAAIPPGLLAALALSAGAGGSGSGRAGVLRAGKLRGRIAGVRPGAPRDGARLALVDTLRAAAPWQPLRRREAAMRAAPAGGGDSTGTASGAGGRRDRPAGATRAAPPSAAVPPRLALRTGDLRVVRLQERTETTTIFAIDASGSSALHRLAEAKGAVELLLADCYVRRDRVAVLAFRGRGAEILLPPTRSLVRARRSLAGLPGGGGTPLAAGIDTASTLADAVLRRGGTPVVVMLTDGRANVARDGAGGRARADQDAHDAARRLRAAGHAALLIDTSPQPQATAAALALSMSATYVPLPRADAASIAAPVRAAVAAPRRRGGAPR